MLPTNKKLAFAILLALTSLTPVFAAGKPVEHKAPGTQSMDSCSVAAAKPHCPTKASLDGTSVKAQEEPVTCWSLMATGFMSSSASQYYVLPETRRQKPKRD